MASLILDALSPLFTALESSAYAAIDRGLIPDFLLRPAIRLLCRQRLRSLYAGTVAERHERKMRFVEGLRTKPVAIEQDKANEQHYEVSTEFIRSCTGPRMKYSSCLFPIGTESLAQAELAMLDLYALRATLTDGQDVLDLGCGWGSLCLYVAETFPNSRVMALSNSGTQREYIEKTAREMGIETGEGKRLDVRTGDVMVWDTEKRFDRILSIEMLEHMKNYEFLFRKISSWLRPEGRFFAHIFCHRSDAYHFEESDGWMAQMFFSGGTMASHDLFAYFQRDLVLQRSWYIPGTHYAKTLESWLKLQDEGRRRWIGSERRGVDGMLNGQEGKKASKVAKDEVAEKTFYRFRVFFMACAEFFALDGGEQWGVGHYLFEKR